MQGFLWLLMQMAILLTAAALLFLWLGWRWRSQDARHQAALLEGRIDAESSAAIEAYGARDAARDELQKVSHASNRDSLELLEARERLLRLERELLRLSDDLKAAKQRADHAEQDQRVVAEQLQEALTEARNLETEVAGLRAASAQAPTTEPAPVRAKRPPRKTAAAKAEIVPKDAQTVLARIESELARHEAEVAQLQHDQEEFQLTPTGPTKAASKKETTRRAKQLAEAQRKAGHSRGQVEALRRALGQDNPASPADDLTRIHGIKPAINARLQALGIRHFRQIAEWSVADVAAFDALLDLGHRPQRDKWVEQARELLSSGAIA